VIWAFGPKFKSRTRRSRRDKRDTHYRTPPKNMGGVPVWKSSKLSGKAQLSDVAVIPSRPDRPLRRSVAFRLIRNVRRTRSSEFSVNNLHFGQLTTVVKCPKYKDMSSMAIYTAWLDLFQLNPSRSRIGPNTLMRLVTLSKRELKMKSSTSYSLVLRRVLRALSERADLKRVKTLPGGTSSSRYRRNRVDSMSSFDSNA
jgi:hypothetical protein